MRQNRVLSFLCVLLASPLAHAATLRLQVEGLSGELEKNVRVRLSAIGSDEVTADGRFRASVDKAVRQGLRPFGYYDPTIDFEYRATPPPGRPVLIARVTPGEPVRIAGTSVVIEGQGKDDEDYQTLKKNSIPVKGTQLNHGTYDSFKSAITNVAVRKGYFDAAMRKSQLGIIQDQHQAFWDIDFDTGQRYRFGRVTFEGAQIRDDYLQNLVPFREGDYYSASDLAELNRRLSATNWFNSVVVAPEFKNAKEHKVLPLNAVVTPRTRNTLETGVGYSTDVGPRIKANWKKPWLNSRGHSLESTLNLSGPEQELDLSYKIPLLKNPIEQYYVVQGGFKREDLNDTESDGTTLNVARYWDASSGWKKAINLRWSLDHFTQGSVTNTTMLIYPGLSVSRTRQRGGLMPDWGDSQRYSLDVSDTGWGSDIDFAVVQAQNVWIRTLAEKHRFVVRGNLGWIETNDFERVPPSLRFFAGGDRSIRGYQYKSISPRDDEGKLTGASKLATGSLEYQYNVTG
ncbi:MAG: autotransporter assembly complex family protein, partial [Yersiniaceae bacterium]|nr:autotransporter assembly complex family protein [Yersiniaceae bacterium]